MTYSTGTKERPAKTFSFVNLETCEETRQEVREEEGATIRPQEDEAIVSGSPTSCIESSLNRCPIHLYRLRFRSDPVEVRSGPRASYRPTYLDDEQVAFQTTERDSSCDGTVNSCRHDIVALKRADLASSALSIIREGAVAATIAPDGKHLAYLTYVDDSTNCHGVLPCPSMDLRVTALGGGRNEETIVAHGVYKLHAGASPV